MRLAWHNISHDRIRFLVTIAGIACATLLMIIQGSLLLGFLGAASKVIDATDADLWIVGRGVPCFEFPVPVERRFAELARGFPGVAATSRVLTRIVPYRKPDGSQQLVTLIAAEAGAGAKFPIPWISKGGGAIEPEALLIDQSNSGLLNPSGQVPLQVEINQLRAHVAGETTGYSSFLGTPYVFTSYTDGMRYGGLRPAETMFILVRLGAGAKLEEVQRSLKARLPTADIWTKSEFADRAKIYWTSQTGAGGAILAAALLGFLIGLAVVSQAIYATTMERIEEFATLKALGASRGFVLKVIVIQSLACGVAGYLLAIGISSPAIQRVRSVIPWLTTPDWLPAAILPLVLTICVLASILSVRAAVAVEPAKVFRA